MIEVKKKGKPFTNKKAYNRLDKLSVGNSLHMSKKDWLLVTPPGAWLLRKRLGKEFTVQTFADDTGWLISRVG